MQYTFNISLSVLNHLGRNLYRSFITVIGEAISNSWDADAKNVWIEIDRDARSMFIVDDGIGMTSSDFQDKFLKIGYSKRVNNESTSPKGRPYVGRKGIGKLALLSCAKRIHIASKAEGFEVVGGIIDNTGLDQAIADDISASNYPLEQFSEIVREKLEVLESGTALFFEDITDGIYNTIDYLRKAIAINFRFSLLDSDFNINLNDKNVTVDDLSVLADATQFVWKINEVEDPYLSRMVSPNTNPSVKSFEEKESSLQMNGFLATTRKPSDLKIPGSNDRVSVDLFVNGRLREKDLLKHIHSARIVESYLYGQIHYNALDNEKDIFTSSREGVLSDDPMFRELLGELKNIVSYIIEKWDVLREAKGGDGDPDNPRRTPRQRKAMELFSATVDEILPTGSVPSHGLVEKWVGELKVEAQFNIPSYTECFVAENLLRQHVQHNEVELKDNVVSIANEWKKRECEFKEKANINYEVRQDTNILYYLSMDDLARLIDKSRDQNKESSLVRDAKVYKPLRDAVAHTSVITEIAKGQLSIIYSNIQERLRHLLIDNIPKE